MIIKHFTDEELSTTLRLADELRDISLRVNNREGLPRFSDETYVNSLLLSCACHEEMFKRATKMG